MIPRVVTERLSYSYLACGGGVDDAGGAVTELSRRCCGVKGGETGLVAAGGVAEGVGVAVGVGPSNAGILCSTSVSSSGVEDGDGVSAVCCDAADAEGSGWAIPVSSLGASDGEGTAPSKMSVNTG